MTDDFFFTVDIFDSNVLIMLLVVWLWRYVCIIVFYLIVIIEHKYNFWFLGVKFSLKVCLCDIDLLIFAEFFSTIFLPFRNKIFYVSIQCYLTRINALVDYKRFIRARLFV